MSGDFPSERSIAESRNRLDYIAGDSLAREAYEGLSSGGVLRSRDVDAWPEDAAGLDNPGRSAVLRNLAASVPGVVQIHGHLGSGTFGHVWECEVAGHVGHVALKVIKPRPGGQSSARECQLHAGLQHPNLVRLLEAIEGPPSAIAMELCPGGTLAQLIHNPAHRHGAAFLDLSIHTRVRAALDVATCVEYLHASDVLHRDIKPGNCLLGAVFEEGAQEIPQVKLSDLGLARHEAQEMSKRVGTLRYMAPELMEGEDYSFPVDVYSSGMLLYELATGLVPFSTSGARMQNDVAFILAVAMGERPALDDSLPPCAARDDLRNTIEPSWDAEPGNRPTAGALAEGLRSLLMVMA